MTPPVSVPGSFRDPAGFVYFDEGEPRRQVNEPYRHDFESLRSSGLLVELHDAELLVRHTEVPFVGDEHPGAIAVLRPETLRMVSYPYEWCFSQLKDAALCTLEVQRRALARGMTLKDASAYNIQFHRGRAMLIDTLSFERYVEGEPWVAYRQFCQHFLAPLALIARVDAELGKLSRTHIDGVPVELASRLLPYRTRFEVGLGLHVHMHARTVRGSSVRRVSRKATVSRHGMLGLVDSLRSTIERLEWSPKGTVWGDYYDNTNYSSHAMASKRSIVREILADRRPRVVWDLGANTGEFSRIAAEVAEFVVACDLDSLAVERNYIDLRSNRVESVLPLVIDLSNPSPALGWAHSERESFLARSNADVVLALALVHHLAIGNNVPLPEVARFLASVGTSLVVEFVPKADSQVVGMLASRKDVFTDFDREGFERAFAGQFRTVGSWPVDGSLRTIYLMERLSRR